MTAGRKHPLRPERNHCELTGVIHSLETIRLTPAGVPTRRFWLEHRSRQEEGGTPREVQARMAVMLTGEAQVKLSNGLTEGQRIRVQGFLARAGARGETRDRLQLHASHIECFE